MQNFILLAIAILSAPYILLCVGRLRLRMEAV